MRDPIGIAVLAIVVIGAIAGLAVYISNNNSSSKSSKSSNSDVAPPTPSNIVPMTALLLDSAESQVPSSSSVPSPGQSSVVPSDVPSDTGSGSFVPSHVPSDTGSGSFVPSSIPSDYLTYSPFFSVLQPIQNGLLPPYPSRPQAMGTGAPMLSIPVSQPAIRKKYS